jgi:hypothetical protein
MAKRVWFPGDFVTCTGYPGRTFVLAKVNQKQRTALLTSTDRLDDGNGWRAFSRLTRAKLKSEFRADFAMEKLLSLASCIEHLISCGTAPNARQKVGDMQWASYDLGRAINGMYGDPRLDRLALALVDLDDRLMEVSKKLERKVRKR